MLVIADQLTQRIGGKRGLTGAGKAEEQRHVARFAAVRRAVHRGDSLLREQIVHHREEAFLHLAAVPGAADQLNFFAQVKCDKVFGVKPLLLPFIVGATGAVEDNEVRRKFSQFLCARRNKHVFHKVRLPGHLGDKADAQPRRRAGAAPGINNIKFLAAQLPGDQRLQVSPDFAAQRLIIVATQTGIGPPDGITRQLVSDDIFVARRAPGKDPGIHSNRPGLGHDAARRAG